MVAQENVNPPSPEECRALAAVAATVAIEAGRLIVEERPRDLGVASTKSSVVDVVTVMDQRSQDLLSRRLAELRPEDGFFGEEKGGRIGTSQITWVLDPIDGTVNYLYDIPAFAVSVAAVVGDVTVPGAWRPVAGAVVNPSTGECFRAQLGGGASVQVGDGPTRELRVAAPDRCEVALVGTGFGYVSTRRAHQAAVLTHVLPSVRDIRRIGSAALDLCHVADGALDGYYEKGLNAWDMAAGWLVVTEAGGVVGDGAGGAPTSDLVIAAGEPLHGQLAELVVSAVRRVGPELG